MSLKSSSDLDITAITVNFKTPEMTELCFRSFRSFYPKVPYVLVDNGGCKESHLLMELLVKEPGVKVVMHDENIGHGPALHYAIWSYGPVETRYAFLLDSDTSTKEGGFLELMLRRFELEPSLFALGWLRYVDENGVAYPNQDQKIGNRYVHPSAMLFGRAKYDELEPFVNTGAPAVRLMKSAIRNGYRLESFPIGDYIDHKIAGTRGMYGGSWWVPTSKQPGQWRPQAI